MRDMACTLLVIGAGPGGYVCAIRAGQLGVDTVVAEANLIASQVASTELGIDFPQEVGFRPIYPHCSVFCETIWNPGQARRMATLAVRSALSRRGVAVLVLPGDIAATEVEEGPAYSLHVPAPVTRPSDAELDGIAALLNGGGRIAVYAGAGCEHAHDQVVRLCEVLKAPMAHTSRAKDFVEPANPFNVGMTWAP